MIAKSTLPDLIFTESTLPDLIFTEYVNFDVYTISTRSRNVYTARYCTGVSGAGPPDPGQMVPIGNSNCVKHTLRGSNSTLTGRALLVRAR